MGEKEVLKEIKCELNFADEYNKETVEIDTEYLQALLNMYEHEERYTKILETTIDKSLEEEKEREKYTHELERKLECEYIKKDDIRKVRDDCIKSKNKTTNFMAYNIYINYINAYNKILKEDKNERI